LLRPEEIYTFARQLCRPANSFINEGKIGGCPELLGEISAGIKSGFILKLKKAKRCIMDSDYISRLINRFKKDLPPNYDLSFQGFKHAMNKIIEDAAKQLSPHAVKRIGMKPSTFYECLTKVGMIEKPDVNGFVKTTDNWKTYQIYVNLGLMMFFHKIIKIFASRVGVMSNNGGIEKNPEIPFDETVACAKKILVAFWNNTLYTTTGFNLMQLSDFQIEFVGTTLNYAEKFVVAHEFGHVIINTASTKPTEIAFIEDALKKILYDKMKLNNLDNLVSVWVQEIASDIIGLELCLECGEDDWDRVGIYSAVQFFFIAQNMLETFYEKTFNSPRSTGSHPPCKLRLEFIRLIVNRDNPTSVSQIGNALEEISNRILESI